MKTISFSMFALLIFSIPGWAATIEDVKRCASSYIDDLPNFICDYTEINYKRNYSPGGGWDRKKWHTGELRWNRSDTRWNRRVLTFKGKPTKKKLHQISGTLGNYGVGVDYSDWEWKKTRGAEQGEDGVQLDVFEVRSESGITLHRGLNKHRNLKKPKAAPATGKIWAEKDTGRIHKVILLYLARGVTYGPHSTMMFEYDYVNIDGKSYLLPKKFTFENWPEYGATRLTTVEHYNFRRFQSKSTLMIATSKIKFGGADLGPEPPPPPSSPKEPQPAMTAKKDPKVGTPKKSSPPNRTQPRTDRPRERRKAKKKNPKNYLALGEPEYKKRKGTNYLSMAPTQSPYDLARRRTAPPDPVLEHLRSSGPKPAPKKKVVSTYVVPFGAILNLLFIVLVIGAGMYFIRIR